MHNPDRKEEGGDRKEEGEWNGEIERDERRDIRRDENERWKGTERRDGMGWKGEER